MLITLEEVLNKYRIRPSGIIHVGAHYAEEYQDYRNCGIRDMVFIEPCDEAFRIMVSRIEDPNVIFIKGACGAQEGDYIMNVSHNNQGQSNSLLKPNLHLTQHPEVVFTDIEMVHVNTLDSLQLDFSKYQMLAMDVQGYEGEVIKGAHKALMNNIDIVYSEVNNGETYTGNMLVEEMDQYLGIYGFKRVETFWPSPNWTWGDSIFVKEKFLTW